jgi:hypothetical protein
MNGVYLLVIGKIKEIRQSIFEIMSKERKKSEILKAIICEDSLIDTRIFGSYCLYFDKVFLPVFVEPTYPYFNNPVPNKAIQDGSFGKYAEFINHPVYTKWKQLTDILVFPALADFGGMFSGPMQEEILFIAGKKAAKIGGFGGLSDLGTWVMCGYHRWTDEKDVYAEPVFVSQHEKFKNKHFLDVYDPKSVQRNAEWLASSIALKAIQMVLPREIDLNAEQILELRAKLEDVLEPFRISMLTFTKDLRGYLSDTETKIEDINEEAEFIVRSSIRPQLYEIRKKIEKHNDTLFRRIFGSTLKVLGLGGKFALMPSPGGAIEFAQGIGNEALAIGGEAKNKKLLSNSGLMFLSEIQDHFSE